jgi:transcriptional repressor NrdR
LHCPFCRGPETRVVDSREAEEGTAIRRRRECGGCGQRWTTFERIEGLPLVVIKRDGGREPFDRAKVVSGIAKACKNRPVSDGAMREICDATEELARERGGEVEAKEIGHLVLERLSELDDVAYVRFASVYRDFSDLAEFERVIAELEKADSKGRVGGRG